MMYQEEHDLGLELEIEERGRPDEDQPLIPQEPLLDPRTARVARWFNGTVNTTSFFHNTSLFQSMIRQLPPLGLAFITALGSITGAESFGENVFSDFCSIPDKYRESVGIVFGIGSYLTSAGVNVRYINQNIAQSSTFPFSRFAPLAWTCALAATSPSIVLGWDAMGGAAIYVKILTSIVASISGSMLAKSGMLDLIDKIQCIGKKATCGILLTNKDRELLLRIAKEAHTHIKEMPKEEREQWFANLVHAIGEPNYDFIDTIDRFILEQGLENTTRWNNGHNNIFKSGFHASLTVIAWFYSGMSVIGNGYFFANTFLGPYVGYPLGTLCSTPNWALMGEELKHFVTDDLATLAHLQHWWRTTSYKKMAVDIASLGISAILAAVAASNSGGIAYTFFNAVLSSISYTEGYATMGAEAAAMLAAIGTYGINFRSLNRFFHSMFQSGPPVDDLFFSVIEGFKAMPKAVVEDVLAHANTIDNNFVRDENTREWHYRLLEIN